LFLFSLKFYIFRVVKGPFLEEFYQCVTYGAYTAEWQAQLYGVASFLLSFMVPLSSLVVTYTCTFVSISSE
jgi:gonadotropin-releasing hormone receptor